MLLDSFFEWMFVSTMIAVGLVFLAAYPPVSENIWRGFGGYPVRSVAAGIVMALSSMLFPWVVGPGQQMDLRIHPMVLVGWLFGWEKSIPIGLSIIAARALGGGGPGFIRTVVWVVITILVQPLFQGRPRNWLWLAMAGLLHTFIGWTMSFISYLPVPPVLKPTSPYWLLLAAVNVLGFWLLNAAMEHVNEKRHLEQKLAEELREKEAVLELIPHGIIFLDARRHVTQCNQAGRALTHSDQVLKAWLSDSCVDRALREQRRIGGCRVAYPDPNGRCGEGIVLISAVPLPNGGAVLGVENVTGVIQQEREEARRHRLELLGRLSAIAAHEIKNPLTTIKGFMQLLSRRPEFEIHRSSFGLVQAEVEHINRVVTDFLGLASNSALVTARFPLDDLFREVLDVTELQFPSSGVRVTLQGEAGLQVDADRQAAKQILKNLVTNAYEAMTSGGSLGVEWARTCEGLEITVTDSGPGISPDILPVIFTPYMTTKSTGTGLGLAISHKLAADMGGRLEVSSEPGRGCSFRLVLPVAVMQAGASVLAE